MGPKGMNVFRVSGSMTHKIGSVEPSQPGAAGFAQIFVIGDHGTAEAQYRIAMAQGKRKGTQFKLQLDVKTIKRIQDLLYKINPYAKIYMHARQILATCTSANLALIGVPRPGCDPKRYNQPSVDEVAMIIEGEGDKIPPRHIILHRNNGIPVAISDLHSYYFPLRYPLLFPYGQQQWDNLYKSNTQFGLCSTLPQIWQKPRLTASLTSCFQRPGGGLVLSSGLLSCSSNDQEYFHQSSVPKP
jgi:hypothetical protein